MNLDLSVFNFINGFAGRQKWLDGLAIFFAKYLGYILAIALVFFAFLDRSIGMFLLPVSAGIFSRFIINEAIYFFYKRKRPAEALGIKSLIKIPKYPAFPSGHASFFFALSFALLSFSVNLGIIFIVLTFFICFFRIFSGVHWPSDILAGAAAGGLSAYLAFNFKTIDLYLFNLINQFTGKWAWLDYLGIFCAEYLGYVLLIVLVIFLATNFKKYWKMVAEAFVAAIFTRFVLAEIIRWLWFMPRPFVVLNFVPLIDQSPKEASFPSGHASFFFALSTIVYYYNKKAGILFYIGSFLIISARVFAGIHWPSDVLAGAIFGILMGWLLNKFFRKHAHKYIKGYNN